MTRVAPAFLTRFQAIQTGSEPIRGLAAGTCRSATGNERLSTAAVTRMLIEADRSRARRNEIVDKLAASYILQGALDRLTHLRAGADDHS